MSQLKSKRKKTKSKAKKKTSKKKLLDQVIQLTGIPSQTIRRELHSILEKKNIRPQDITLDQLRAVAASYLREIMGGLLENTHLRRSERQH
jgi:hypothetical protein